MVLTGRPRVSHRAVFLHSGSRFYCGIPYTCRCSTPTFAGSALATPFSRGSAFPLLSTRGNGFAPWLSRPIRPVFRSFLLQIWPACCGRCMVLRPPCPYTARTTSLRLDFNASTSSSLLLPHRMLPSRSCRSHLVVLFAAVPSGSASRLLPPLCKTWPLPPLLPFHCRPQPCPGVCLNCPRACRIWCCVCLAPLPCGRPAWPTSGHANVPGSSQNLQGHPHARAVRQRRDAALCDRTEKVCPPS